MGRVLLLGALVLIGCAPAPPVIIHAPPSYAPATTAVPHDPESYYTPPVTTIPEGPDVTDAEGNLLPTTEPNPQCPSEVSTPCEDSQ